MNEEELNAVSRNLENAAALMNRRQQLESVLGRLRNGMPVYIRVGTMVQDTVTVNPTDDATSKTCEAWLTQQIQVLREQQRLAEREAARVILGEPEGV